MPRRRRPPRAGALGELPPLKIAAQIATLQALFYVAALALMLFTTLVAGTSFSLDLIFSWDRVRGDTTQGWLMAFVWILDGGFCMAVAIVVFIARSKLVPDFALTVHFLHLVLTGLYTRSLPAHAMWWATMLASSALSVALATWGCQYRELQPIFFGGRRILGASGGGGGSGAGESPEHDDNGGDEEMGLGSRGRRGRGRDEYEMGKMTPTA